MYNTGQFFNMHWDPMEEEGNKLNRLTTIFAILEDNCDDCGTQFPNIAIDWSNEDPAWCETMIDCTKELLTFPPKVGNAVFWRNRKDDGTIHEKALHAGLPTKNGTKMGLNIWTGNQPEETSDLYEWPEGTWDEEVSADLSNPDTIFQATPEPTSPVVPETVSQE